MQFSLQKKKTVNWLWSVPLIEACKHTFIGTSSWCSSCGPYLKKHVTLGVSAQSQQVIDYRLMYHGCTHDMTFESSKTLKEHICIICWMHVLNKDRKDELTKHLCPSYRIKSVANADTSLTHFDTAPCRLLYLYVSFSSFFKQIFFHSKHYFIWWKVG